MTDDYKIDTGKLKVESEPYEVAGQMNDFKFIVPQDAPIFEPTDEEFQDPLAFINKIRPIAEKTGICKIRPPKHWRPPFVVDLDNLRFTPRIQRLNELEAMTRVKFYFLDQISKFWDLQGSSVKIPTVERRVLDLYELHRVVQQEGGYDHVSSEKKWAHVATRMNYPPNKNVGATLKGHYERILYPFDIFKSEKPRGRKVKVESDSEKNETETDESNARRTRPKVNGKTTPKKDDKSTIKKEIKEIDASKLDNKELKRLQFYGAGPKMADFSMPKGKLGKSKPVVDPLAKYICQYCGRGDAEESMLLCDGCDDSYHTFCLLPKLSEIPKGDWRCPKCVDVEVSKPMEAFGFEQAQREYTLTQFGEMADTFKADYFNMPLHMVPLSLVEREFWRIVTSIDEDVTVEYGADLHSMDHGSGFPMKSNHYDYEDDRFYANSNWNLNNFATLEGSVLSHINADISGMKVPWMYVGMCFSAFCWHNEDHWSYSINYLHWGEPKTWYGVPGSKAEQFEESMKSAAPELFQSQPDLLHQLVTIMNPNTLMQAGVPVYRLDQKAGEFVVTFPRAYHAGFNQGFNFAEAVNFAPADWIKVGRECINHYSHLRRFCVFSHDELVCKMSLDPEKLDLTVAASTYQDMVTMVKNEKELRKNLLDWGVKEAEREAFELLPDDERQCEVCKTTCFLSATTCTCSPNKLVCLRHFEHLCSCSSSKHMLRYRYTLDELAVMLQKLKIRAESFDNWINRVKMVLEQDETKRVTLSGLKELLAEADKKRFPKCELTNTLKTAVVDAEKCADVIQQLDLNKIRTRNNRGGDHKCRFTLEELQLFCDEIDNLACSLPESKCVKVLLNSAMHFQEEMEKFLAITDITEISAQKLQQHIEFGNDLCVTFPLMPQLLALNQQVKWLQEIVDKKDVDAEMTLERMQKWINIGKSLSHNSVIEAQINELKTLTTSVIEWEKEAKLAYSSRSSSDVGKVKDLLDKANFINALLPSKDGLVTYHKKITQWLDQYVTITDEDPYLDTVEQMLDASKDLRMVTIERDILQRQLNEANVWRDKAGKIFLTNASKHTLLDALCPQNCSEITKKSKSPPVEFFTLYKLASRNETEVFRKTRETNNEKYLNEKYQISSPTKYCVCNDKRVGNMVQCSLCMEWYHTSCVEVPRNITEHPKYKLVFLKELQMRSRTDVIDDDEDNTLLINEYKYLCIVCQRTQRPRLKTILELLMQLQQFNVRLPEGQALQYLSERAMEWQERACELLHSKVIVEAKSHLNFALKKLRRTKFKRLSSESTNFESSLLDDFEFESITEYKTVCYIHLDPSVHQKLTDMMLESDLIELSLDESYQLWQLLQASKPIMPLEKFVVNFDDVDFNMSDKLTVKRKSQEYTPSCSSPKILALSTSPQFRKKKSLDKMKKTKDTNKNIKRSRGSGLMHTTKLLRKKHQQNIKKKKRSEDSDSGDDESDDCAADVCLKPSSTHVDWVQCDGGCDKWFHMHCVGIKKTDITDDDEYYCDRCADEKRPESPEAMIPKHRPAFYSSVF